MKKHLKIHNKEVSDRDFIFDIFSSKGFAINATNYLKNDQSNDLNTNDCEDAETEKSSEPE
ncbi:hypothetical protein [Carboxylicivirga sp. RSCT41]|uniref:hypothetical protein n=1 Tax=Carboxylicivirga agarovorans TaxID=3417570 RepID=UPI003D33EB4C